MTHKLIGFFGTPEDQPYFKTLQTLTAGTPMKASLAKMELFTSIAIRVKQNFLTHLIVTCPTAMKLLLEKLPDYRKSYNKNGSEKALSLNDYHGSYFQLPGHLFGREEPCDVLILNPLQHLMTVPEAKFVFARFISKITQPDKWFPHIEMTWEVVKPETQDYWLQRFSQAKVIAIDTETTRDSPHRTLETVQYTGLWADGTVHTVVIEVLGLEKREQEFANILWMRKMNALPIAKVFQNGMYDNAYFARYNSPVSHWFFDTQHLFHSLYAELPKSLDYITVFYVRYARFWKNDNKTGKRFDFLHYGAQDGWATMMTLLGMITEYPAWAEFNYVEHEFPLVFPCLHVGLDGLKVDPEKFKHSFTEVSGKTGKSLATMQAWLGPSFNPASPLQVQKLMRNLGVKDVDSSNEKYIQVAQAESPFNERVLGEVLNYRGYAKLLSTYLDESKFWHGRLLYGQNPAGTDTLRLATKESWFWCGFQIQNVPRGPEIKSYLMADDRYLMGEADYAQSEARCVGYLSGCESLIELVESSHDYHAWNAAAFFGVPYEAIYDEERGKTIDKELRDLSKRTNHGANYNMGPDVMLLTMGPKNVRIAKAKLKLPDFMGLRAVCEYLLQQYVRTYPEVKVDYQTWLKRQIPLTRKLVSSLGWTRYCFGDPNKSKQMLNSYVAHVPQNLSVSIINEVFYKIWRESVYGSLRKVLRVKAQIHDSILFCYAEDRPDVAETVRRMMENPKEITDIKGVTRTMLIPPDLSCGKKYWNELK